MIRNNKGEVGLECDECGDEHWAGTLGFRDMLEEAKQEGWRVWKKDDEWVHSCPDCADDRNVR